MRGSVGMGCRRSGMVGIGGRAAGPSGVNIQVACGTQEGQST